MNQNNLPYNNRVFYYGECIDNKDPDGLGRIRAILKTENTADRELSTGQGNGLQKKDEWTSKDPFVIRPLLPVFVNTIPKEKEFVHLIYSNSDDKSNKDKFYIGGVHSSLTTLNQEPYESAVKNANLGSRDKDRKKYRDKLTGEETDPKTKGVYSKPNDISIDGRGSADIIIQDDSVLLRAGKFNTNPTPNVYPIGNDNRAFLQLSKYNEKIVYGEPKKFKKFKFEDKSIKLLIEYNIQNPENNSDSYTGQLFIYTLQPTEKTGTQNFTISSDVETEKSLFKTFSFNALSKSKITELVNAVLQGICEGLIPYMKDISPSIQPEGPFGIDKGLSFPFYFRPQQSLYDKLKSDTTPTSEKLFITNLMSGIKINESDTNGGYGLVYDDTKRTTVPYVAEDNNVIPKNVLPINNTAALMGGDYLYLLSHKSSNSGGQINLSDTLYGVGNRIVSDEIEPKTSSMVRGEELIELLDLIVQFLVGHVHPWHGMIPDGTSVNGVSVENILKELRNANQKILNKYIRIN